MNKKVEDIIRRNNENFSQSVEMLSTREITQNDIQKIISLLMIMSTEHETGKMMAAELFIEWIFTKRYLDEQYEIYKDVATLSRDEYGEFITASCINELIQLANAQPTIDAKIAELLTRMNVGNLSDFMK